MVLLLGVCNVCVFRQVEQRVHHRQGHEGVHLAAARPRRAPHHRRGARQEDRRQDLPLVVGLLI